MTARPVQARSRRAGALLAAVAVLVTGCATAGGGSGPRADRAGPARHSVAASPPGPASPTRHSVAASPPGRVAGHRIAGAPRPGSIRQGSGAGIAGASPLASCAPPLGDPEVNQAGTAPRPRMVVPECLCCPWCACTWACCNCGPGRWPPGLHLAWRCCPRWLGPPGGDRPPIWPACGSGCGSGACPVGPARPAAGAVQARSPGCASLGAS